jgi:hypothetical protein
VNDEFLLVFDLIVFTRPSNLSYGSRYVKRISPAESLLARRRRIVFWPQRAAAAASAFVRYDDRYILHVKGERTKKKE